ncbi:MAG: S49 family peptidase [Prevotella sp.]|jgi:ClpP class serine protease|nr:S49 family peptidase [Prevotella sp.]
MLELLLNEILLSKLLMHPSSFGSLETLVQKLVKGEKPPQQDIKTFFTTLGIENKIRNSAFILPDENYSGNPFDNFEENSIAVIPVIGTMLKYDSWWNYGMDSMANLIRLADSSSKIIGTILLANTPGGTSQSVIQLEDALRNRTKPSIGLIDGMCCSGGIYALSFCDRILATNPMCIAGNIGVYIQIVDDDKMYENYGIKFIIVTPPESKFKNLAYRQAKEGDDKMLVQEDLSPYAIHFQNLIKDNRPKLDLSIEGIIQGKDFYAADAVTYGLIDGITNFEGAAQALQSLHDEKQSIYSSFKK